jgi:hypothetical protein
VGQVLRRHGHEVPWQRVVTASGAPAGAHAEEQLALLRLEGTPLLDGGRRVDLAAARWHWRGRDQPLGRPSHTGAGSAAGPRNVGGAWSNRPIRTSKD